MTHTTKLFPTDQSRDQWVIYVCTYNTHEVAKQILASTNTVVDPVAYAKLGVKTLDVTALVTKALAKQKTTLAAVTAKVKSAQSYIDEWQAIAHAVPEDKDMLEGINDYILSFAKSWAAVAGGDYTARKYANKLRKHEQSLVDAE